MSVERAENFLAYNILLKSSEPLDIKRALAKYKGDKVALSQKLFEFITMSLNVCLKDISDNIDSQDWCKVKEAAQNLYDTSGYIGATRIHYICWSISLAYSSNKYEGILELYVLLIESSIELRRFAWKFANEDSDKPGNVLVEPDTCQKVDLPKGFSTAYNNQVDKYYCLKPGQTLEQRMKNLNNAITLQFLKDPQVKKPKSQIPEEFADLQDKNEIDGNSSNPYRKAPNYLQQRLIDSKKKKVVCAVPSGKEKVEENKDGMKLVEEKLSNQSVPSPNGKSNSKLIKLESSANEMGAQNSRQYYGSSARSGESNYPGKRLANYNFQESSEKQGFSTCCSCSNASSCAIF